MMEAWLVEVWWKMEAWLILMEEQGDLLHQYLHFT